MASEDDERREAEQRRREDGSDPTAARDLADGLELMLRAARKALKNVDSSTLEDLGRRAIRGLEQVDRQKVQDFGRKAVRNLDPRRVEEVAEDAGRELLAVVERVAERIDGLIGGARSRSEPPSQPARDEDAEPEAPRPRIETEKK